MNETSKETYEFGKLRKYLTVVKIQRQDTLKYLAMKSLKAYNDSLISFIPYKVAVKNSFDVRNFFSEEE